MDETVKATMRETVRRLRRERGMGQKEVAALLGCPRSTYANYETGARDIPLTVLLDLAAVYGVPLERLVGRAVLPPSDDLLRLAQTWEEVSIAQAMKVASDMTAITGTLLQVVRACLDSGHPLATLRQALRETQTGLLAVAQSLDGIGLESPPPAPVRSTPHDSPPC